MGNERVLLVRSNTGHSLFIDRLCQLSYGHQVHKLPFAPESLHSYLKYGFHEIDHMVVRKALITTMEYFIAEENTPEGTLDGKRLYRNLRQVGHSPEFCANIPEICNVKILFTTTDFLTGCFNAIVLFKGIDGTDYCCRARHHVTLSEELPLDNWEADISDVNELEDFKTIDLILKYGRIPHAMYTKEYYTTLLNLEVINS